MKNSSQFLKEEDEKTMITSTWEKNGDEGESVSKPRRGRGEQREEGLLKSMMITRPKGGNKYLCMDSDEIKACNELGFELEEDKLKLEFDTHWPISKPGDDPREVKARLKLWAQAVAQASASSHRRARG